MSDPEDWQSNNEHGGYPIFVQGPRRRWLEWAGMTVIFAGAGAVGWFGTIEFFDALAKVARASLGIAP
jgi:drug/metabolite transporter (DMT)-like permease